MAVAQTLTVCDHIINFPTHEKVDIKILENS